MLLKLVNHQVYKINLFVNQHFANVSDLLKQADILKGKKLYFIYEDSSVEISKDKILSMEMQKICLNDDREY